MTGVLERSAARPSSPSAFWMGQVLATQTVLGETVAMVKRLAATGSVRAALSANRRGGVGVTAWPPGTRRLPAGRL
jgi:hypothetical protein